MSGTNNAVAEELGRAHMGLLEEMQRLEKAAGPCGPTGAGEGLAELRTHLDATRTHILEHFRFEEQNGYMDVVSKREPRLQRVIEELAQEHRQLAQTLDALTAQARAVSPDDRFREEVRAWVKAVRQHEVREDELILDAFNLDIGTKD